MIKDFGNKTAFDLFHKGECKQLPRAYWKRAIFLMDVMDAVENLDELVIGDNDDEHLSETKTRKTP